MASESLNKRLLRLERTVSQLSPKEPKLYYMNVARKDFDQAMAIGGPPSPVVEFDPEIEGHRSPLAPEKAN